jgi:hypothetical protein
MFVIASPNFDIKLMMKQEAGKTKKRQVVQQVRLQIQCRICYLPHQEYKCGVMFTKDDDWIVWYKRHQL